MCFAVIGIEPDILMARNRINLLFCSVGRRVELLRDFKQAFEKLGLERHIVAVDLDPLAPALREADCSYLVPPVNSDQYVPTLVQICRQEQIDIVFPYIEPEVAILGSKREPIEETGARLTTVAHESLEIACDKWYTTQLFKELQLPTPDSWLPDNIPLNGLDYPVFIKPRRGSASKDAYRLNSEKELKFFTSYICNPIIQQFVQGTELTTDVMCDLEGNVLTVVSRQRIAVRGGEIVKGVTVYYPDVTEASVKIATALGATGPISVQCILKDGVPYYTEVNARFGGGFPLSVAAGADSPYLLLARTAGIPVEIPPLDSYRTGVYMTRFDQSLFLDKDNLDRTPMF